MLKFLDDAWDEYIYWENQDRKTLKRINSLIKSIKRDGLEYGMGKPEPLKYQDGWSRRINHRDRLVYTIMDGDLIIVSCKGHY